MTVAVCVDTVNVKVALGVKKQETIISETLERILPYNMVFTVELLYNTWAIATIPSGSSVTCKCGSKTLTATSTGTVTFNLTGYGTWVVTATKDGQTATESVVVDDVKQYKISLSYFSATLKVTSDSGATVTATNGTKTFSGTVPKKTSAGSQSSTINTNSMKLFLFSEIEIFGSTTYSKAGEGSQYSYFATAANRIKYLSNGSGSASWWWERSPISTNAPTKKITLENFSFCFSGAFNAASFVKQIKAFVPEGQLLRVSVAVEVVEPEPSATEPATEERP